jgi:hypothetical protein
VKIRILQLTISCSFFVQLRKSLEISQEIKAIVTDRPEQSKDEEEFIL